MYYPKISVGTRLSDFLQIDEWQKIDYKDVRPGDRVLVVRMHAGTRQTIESDVDEFSQELGTWVNSMGMPIVYPSDLYIFKAQLDHDYQSPGDPYELQLG